MMMIEMMIVVALMIKDNRMEPLYAPIRYKLATALTNWHPADPSAKMMLEPWQKASF